MESESDAPKGGAEPTPSSPTSGERAIAWSFVAAQTVLILALILVPGAGWTTPSWAATLGKVLSLLGIAGMLAGALNLGRALTPLPLPNGATDLRTGGLYRLVRHPIYSGLLTFGVGQALSAPSGLRIGSAIALIVLINLKARWEEKRLVSTFPAYPRYVALTPRFVPSVRLLRRGSRIEAGQNGGRVG